MNIDLSLFIPEIALIIVLVVAIFIDVIAKNKPQAVGVWSVIGYLITTGLVLCCNSASTTLNGALLASDSFANFFKVLILAGAIIGTLFTFNSRELLEGKNRVGEFYILLIGMTFGMMLLSSATNLIMIYLAFETMSLCSYVLAGYTKEVLRSSEASLKYVIYGSLASGLMIYGMSMLFGLTGTLDLTAINASLSVQSGNDLAIVTSGILIFAGIAYKISAVPFHSWTPDVYEGSPVATTALLSVISKAAGFAVLFRFLSAGFIDTLNSTENVWATLGSFDWQYTLGIISVLTMTLGNLIAVWQTNVKRLLAYSSIAHCGYMLMGVMVMTTAGMEGVMFYFIVYLLMNFGAFYVVQLIANKVGSEDMDDWNGIAYKNPYIAVAMVIFMLSLTGMPPFAGFLGKWYLFTSVVQAGYVGIAVIGVLNSVVSVFYYVKVVRCMILRGDTETTERISFGKPAMIFLYAMVVPVALMLVQFNPLLNWIKDSASMIIK